MHKTTHPNEIYAVIVGIDRYRDFDPSGACDLLGAANDANAWVSLLQDRFYVPAEHIRLLSTGSHPAASPMPEAPLPQRLEPTMCGIEGALSWLAKMLSREGASGLIAYSGHGIELPGYEGDQQGMNLAICPTDITPSLEGALTLSDLQERLLHVLKSLGGCDPSSVLQNLTIVIDACYRSGDRLASSRTLGGSRKHIGAPLRGYHSLHTFIPRLMLAGHLDETAYESRFAGQWHGVFSATLQLMIEQWRVVRRTGDQVYSLNASYADLMFRTRSLIETLAVPQSPALVGGPPNVALLPVLRPGRMVPIPSTSPTPDAHLEAEQLDPESTGFAGYVLEVTYNGTYKGVLGRAVVPGLLANTVQGVRAEYQRLFTQKLEYWYFDAGLAWYAAQGSSSSVTLKLVQRESWSNLSGGQQNTFLDNAIAMGQRLTPTSSVLQSAEWQPLLQPNSWSAYKGTITVSGVTYDFGLQLKGLVRSSPDEFAVQEIVWFVKTVSGNAPTTFFGGAGQGTSFTLSWGGLGNPPSGQSWMSWPPQ